MHGYQSAGLYHSGTYRPGTYRPGIDPSGFDLTSCDLEPIHIPGLIQPHGILFGVSPDKFGVSAISENVIQHVGISAQDLLDTPLHDVIDDASFAAITASDSSGIGETIRLSNLRLRGSPEATWRARLHRNTQGILLEAEPLQPSSKHSALEHFEFFQDATQRLHAVNDISAMCEKLAEEIGRMTGHDRVMIYRFAADHTGEVVAEANSGKLPAYLGLHFPASDIPAQARALYVSNVERQIPDVGYASVKLLCNRPGDLDLSQVGVRGVSPLHIAYLQNMGVGASMSISILHQGRLWGLVACHHHSAHNVSPELRQAGVLLAQLAGVRLGQMEQAQISRRSIAVKAVETRLLHEAADGHDYRAALRQNSRLLLDLLDATGIALASEGTVTTLGDTPNETELQDLVKWLNEGSPELLATDHLAAQFAPAASWSNAAGILCLPLGGMPLNLLIWFRPEIARTVTWAGDPLKPTTRVDNVEHLTPRASFAKWSEEVRGRSRPWTIDEIAAANGLRDTIVEIIVRRSLQLEQMNSKLARSNEELEAFAYVASHDLKEPLRQIETFGTLLQRAFARKTDPEEKIARWFAGIQNSSRRLRLLINELAEYARLTGQARPFQPVDLNVMLSKITDDFEGRIEELSASITVEPLPVLMCDPLQMRQVMQNLISNSLKYCHPERPPVIHIRADTAPTAGAARKLGLPVVVLSIEDNGIGFDERFCERIFEPFERLHSSDKYEGTGLGLAICRKVVEHHGGTITATSQVGKGTTFVLILPQRKLPDQKARDR